MWAGRKESKFIISYKKVLSNGIAGLRLISDLAEYTEMNASLSGLKDLAGIGEWDQKPPGRSEPTKSCGCSSGMASGAVEMIPTVLSSGHI